MTYHVCEGGDLWPTEVTLKNGDYFEYSGWELLVIYQDMYVYGDFDHDGLEDAAVIISENTGGSINMYTVAFLINDGHQLVHRASIILDDHALIDSMQEKENKVVIDMYIHQEHDSRAGPTRHVRESYEYPGPDIFMDRIETDQYLPYPEAVCKRCAEENGETL